MRWERLDDRRLRILGTRREFLFELSEGQARLEAGSSESPWINVFPSVKCLPVFIRIAKPETAVSEKVVYQITVVK